MYPSTVSSAAEIRAPHRPAWLRLVRDPLSAGERAALAARRGTLTCAADVAALLRDRALAEEVECLYVVALNAKMHAVSVEEVARGSALATTITPRELLRLAVLLGACAIIVAHNHPSGDPTPSESDVELTRRLVAAGEAIGIPVVDHVIVAGAPTVRPDWYFSFREHGLVASR